MQVSGKLKTSLHLVRRFFEHVRASPLTPSEQDEVRIALEPSIASLFFSQGHQDQRHAFSVALRASVLGGGPETVTAALVHDVGKRHADIGALARSVATVLDGIGVPLRGRWRAYRTHGALGAHDLEAAGASALAVEFARRHPARGDLSEYEDAWEILLKADHASGT